MLPIEDVLQSASLVSITWHEVSSSDTVWTSFLSDRNIPCAAGADSSPVDCFRRAVSRPKNLVVLGREALCVFDCAHERWTDVIPLTREVNVNEWSAFAYMSDASLICTGGDKGGPNDPKKFCSNRSFRICAAEITRLRDMTCCRERHGLIIFRGDVYVFGGRSVEEPLRSCELLRITAASDSLPSRDWERLPDMFTPRYAFNPCSDDKFIYLCGGVTNAAESFYPETNTFAPLNFKLPDEAFSHSSLLIDSDLVVLSRIHLTKWNGKKKKLEIAKHKGLHGNVSSYMNGLVCHKAVYKPSIGVIRKFNLSTMSESEIEIRLTPPRT